MTDLGFTKEATPGEGVREFYRKQGEARERKRIIKLLDTDFWHHRIWGNPKPTCVQDCPTCDLIALIKGEQK